MPARLKDLLKNGVLALTLLAGLALAGYYSYVLRQEDLKTWKLIKVKFTDVGGLEEKDPVMVNGARVGRVGEIKLYEDQQLVVLVLEVEPQLEIRADYVAEVVATSALGSVAVELGPPKGGSKSAILDPEVDTIQGKVREGARVPGPERQREFTKNIRAFADETKRLLDPEEGFVGGMLFSPDRALDVAEGLDGLARTWEGIDDTLAEVEYGDSGATGVLSRESLLSATGTFEAFANSLTSLRDGLRRVESGEGALGGFLADSSYSVGWRDALIWQRDFWHLTVQGEGTIGRWVNSEETADNLHDLVHRLEVVTEKGTHGEGLLGVLGSKAGGDSARQFGRGLVRTTTNMRNNSLVKNKDARRDAADFVGNLDDFLVTLRRAIKSLRFGLDDKTFQGVVFAIF